MKQAQNQTDYNSASPNVWGQMIYVLFYGLCDWLSLNVRTSVCVYEGCQIVLRNHCNLSRGAVEAERSKPPHSTRCSKLEGERAREREISFLNQMFLCDLSISNQTPSLLLCWHEGEV